MNLKLILNAILDAAEARWPSWKGLFELLRPFIAAAIPPDGGTVLVGAAPQSIVDSVVAFLQKIADGSPRWIVRYGIAALISVVPSLLNGIWDSLFPGQPKPVMAAVPVDFGAALLESDGLFGFDAAQTAS